MYVIYTELCWLHTISYCIQVYVPEGEHYMQQIYREEKDYEKESISLIVGFGYGSFHGGLRR